MASINEEKPNWDSGSTSVQNSGIALLIAATIINTDYVLKTLIMIALFTHVSLSLLEARLKKRKATGWALVELLRFLVGFFTSILIASATVPILLWIGLTIWAIFFVEGVMYLVQGDQDTLTELGQWIRKKVMKNDEMPQ